MSEVTITVRGEHEERLPAEQGVVRLTVRVEASDRGVSIEKLAAEAGPIREALRTREEAGALLS